MSIIVNAKRLSVESNLGDLADVCTADIAEVSGVSPIANRWYSIGAGDEVRIRFGLAGGEVLDFGVFVVDRASVSGSAESLTQSLEGRGEAYKLIDSSKEKSWGPPEEENQGAFTDKNPWASKIAADIAGLAGLGGSWGGPDWQLRSFALGSAERLSSALDRLLAPLRGLQRYPMDAWVRGGTLFVQQRFSGGSRGTIDIRKAESFSVQREYQSKIGNVTVIGASYREPTGAELDSRRAWGLDDGETQVEEEYVGDENGMVITIKRKYWTREGTGEGETEGKPILVTKEVERRFYEKVFGSGTAGEQAEEGKLLKKTETTSQMNLEKEESQRKETKVEQKYGYKVVNDEWFRIIEQETTARRYWDDPELVFKERRIIYETQVTPKEVRRTTIQLRILPDGTMIAEDKPEIVQEPGVLSSVLRLGEKPSGEDDWGFDVSGTSEVFRNAFVETAYSGTATGDGAEAPYSENIGEVGKDEFCAAVAGRIVAEHGIWRYTIGASFANEMRYLCGDTVSLSNIPGVGLLDAVVTGVRTEIDGDGATFKYDLEFEAWA